MQIHAITRKYMQIHADKCKYYVLKSDESPKIVQIQIPTFCVLKVVVSEDEKEIAEKKGNDTLVI